MEFTWVRAEGLLTMNTPGDKHPYITVIFFLSDIYLPFRMGLQFSFVSVLSVFRITLVCDVAKKQNSR